MSEISPGDFVTRNSYNNDTVFQVIAIDENEVLLKGVDVRLFADSPLNDLVKVEEKYESDEFMPEVSEDYLSNRDDFFYLPAKILHIDGDKDYLVRCLDFYKKHNLMAVGKALKEEEIPKKIYELLKKYKPDIVIITGHDAFYRKNGKIDDINSYKNTSKFIEAVKEARRYESSHEKLVIIAGACQSNYEELIKAGANFASSPKRVNIHALDPAIIASSISLTERNENIDLLTLLEKTKYGKAGIGGLKCTGLMYVGYPRQ